MKKLVFLLMSFLISDLCIAGCDLTKFRWGCTIYPKIKNTHRDDALIYCGSTKLYVSKQQFDLIKHYQNTGVHMSIMVNDVYYDGPCVAANHKVDLRRPDKVQYF